MEHSDGLPSVDPDRPSFVRDVVRSSHDAIVAVSLSLEILTWNPAAERLYGYRADEVIGQSLDLLIPDDRQTDEREIVSLLVMGARLDRYRTQRRRRDGSVITVSVTVSPVTDAAGRIVGATSIARGISERERAEASFQAVLEAAPDAIVGVAGDGRVVLSNMQAEALFDLPRNGLIGTRIETILPGGLPEPVDTAGEEPPGAAASSGPAGEPPAPAASPGPAGPAGLTSVPQPLARRSDGRTLPVEILVSTLETDEGPVRCAVIRDITDRLLAQAEQERLRAEAERIRMEGRLQRTQRLESLGQLAGGIAHDFNNLVAVILNYAAFVTEEATEAGLDSIARDAEQIIRAGRRGADLTHQLLAFARREVVRPRVLDLNQAVTGVEDMLRRSIGEHISLITRLAPDLPAVTADPGQLEQVLVNLAVNARDVMPQGGQLAIDTGPHEVDAAYATARPNLRPGRYAQLRVSDTGPGMPREVAERAFEPFFTTKPTGEGTGLGLATVYGIIIQAGGDVHIYSEPGMGTTVTILLPATDQRPVGGPATAAAVPLAIRGETVLLAEDEPALRQVIERMLTTAGYRVLIAPDTHGALDLATDHAGAIDLLLTDVVMPHMLGKDLAQHVRKLRPDVAVLYMSGYARPILASRGTLDADVVLLEKPFTRPELLAAVRRRLEDRA